MAQKEMIFLPMTDAAVDCIISFTDIDYVKQVFAFYKHRNKTASAFHDLRHQFEKVTEKEGEVKYHFKRMAREIDFLYYNTTPSLHESIKRYYNNQVKFLNDITKRKSVISSLKTSNSYKALRFFDLSGEIMETPKQRSKTEQLDLKLLETPLFDEYLMLLEKLVILFRFEATRFLAEEDKIEEDEISDGYLFSETEANYIIADWARFLSICNEYSKEPILYKSHLNTVIVCKDKKTNKYEWQGAEDNKIPLLAQFISRLAYLGIVRKRKKKPIAEFFLKFFDLTGEYKNAHYLSTLFNLKDNNQQGNLFIKIE